MTEHVGPDGTRYKIIRNPLPDPQDYGWLERSDVTDCSPEKFDEILQENYIKPVMAAIREIEATMSPMCRAFLTGLPNGHVWEELRREREEEEPLTTCRHPDQGVPP